MVSLFRTNKLVICLTFFIFLSTTIIQAQTNSKQLQNILTLSINHGKDTALGVLRRWEVIAKNSKDTNLIVLLIAEKSLIYTNDLQIDKALKIADSAIVLGKRSKQYVALADALFARASINNFRHNIIDVLKDCQAASSLLEGSDAYFLQSRVYNLFFNIYTGWIDADKMKYYVNLLASVAKKDTSDIVLGYMANHARVLNKWQFSDPKDSAKNAELIREYLQLEKIYEDNPNKISRSSYIVCLLNEIAIRTRDPNLKYHKEGITLLKNKCATITENLKGIKALWPLFQGMLYLNYSNINEIEGGPESTSISYIKKAYDILQNNSFRPYYEKLIQLSEVLSHYYEGQGDYKMALQYEQHKSDFSSKLFDQDKSNAIRKLELENAEKVKNNQLKTVVLKNKNERNIFIFTLVASLFFIVGLFYVIRTYQFKVKYAKEKEAKLNVEKAEMSLNARLAEEAQKHLEMEKELMFLRQERLQKEVLSNQLQIEHKNELLNDINEKLKEGIPFNISKLIKEEVLIDSDFDATKKQIQDVHPDFFPKLDRLSNQKLTNLDMKISAYLHLNMETKQIAQNLNIEPKSVRMAKYRLKQKLGLSKELDLEAFLRQIK